jgi:hypothetical protein
MSVSGADSLFKKAPYNRFGEFIAPGADRLALLVSVLKENGLAPRVLSAKSGGNHVVLGGGGAAARRAVVLLAHYDRVSGSPGANDNSAAVFMLIKAAMSIFAVPGTRGGSPAIIFTDKEELSRGERITDQGAYSLALRLREQGLFSARIFCFDACGAGDTVIISTEADRLLRNETSVGAARIRRRVGELRSAALNAARLAGIEKVLLLPVPFSDDAGLFRAGLVAQTITVLPGVEAAAFAALVRTRPGIASALAGASPDRGCGGIPGTWKRLNGPEDTSSFLTARHWNSIVRLAKALCG